MSAKILNAWKMLFLTSAIYFEWNWNWFELMMSLEFGRKKKKNVCFVLCFFFFFCHAPSITGNQSQVRWPNTKLFRIKCASKHFCRQFKFSIAVGIVYVILFIIKLSRSINQWWPEMVWAYLKRKKKSLNCYLFTNEYTLIFVVM